MLSKSCILSLYPKLFNPLFFFLLQTLFLDHDIIFYFKTTLKKIKKNLSQVLNTFENIMENGAFAQGANAPFSIIFLNM